MPRRQTEPAPTFPGGGSPATSSGTGPTQGEDIVSAITTGRYSTQRPGHQLLQASPENLARLQQSLVSAGLLTGTFAMGVADTKTQTAYEKLLTFANQIGTSWQEALTVYGDMAVRASGGQITGGVGPTQEQFTPQVTSTEDLMLALKDASGQLRAGGAFDDATLARLAQVYQAQERAEQEAAFNAELHGGTVEAPTSAETMLRNTVREADPAGVGAREVADRYRDFLGMLNNNGLGPVKL